MSNLEKFQDLATIAHPVGSCFVCGKPLPMDRKLICTVCADPKGTVAMVSRMLRGKYLRP
jgi:predicted amidophosphoribosyltransferase